MLKQRQERCSKGAVKLREVKVKEAKERRVASASLVAKKATGGIPYRLRRTKAKAKAKAEEKVARVKARGTLRILHSRWG